MLRSQLSQIQSKTSPAKLYIRFSSSKTVVVEGKTFAVDTYTNVTPSVLSKIGRNLHMNPKHPLGILRGLIESHFPAATFTRGSSPSPVVSVYQNFDSLLFPKDHIGRSRSDSYYINKDNMLRTHTSAHEVELFQSGLKKFIQSADVYRRDEVDRSHYPVFHQMEGAYVVEATEEAREAMRKEIQVMADILNKANILIEDTTVHNSETNPVPAGYDVEDARLVTSHLKHSLNTLALSLFGPLQKNPDVAGLDEGPLKVRWIEASFPWTGPSYEVEVWFRGKWLEILGSGVERTGVLENGGLNNHMGWAFGLGLERIAMVLFSIPDIRLFWSTDMRFLSQFEGEKIVTFKPYSKYPLNYNDISFWMDPAQEVHPNDFAEIVRDVAGDLVENVEAIDEFTHPKTGKMSVCYRLGFRSLDRTLENEEVNIMVDAIAAQAVERFNVQIR